MVTHLSVYVHALCVTVTVLLTSSTSDAFQSHINLSILNPQQQQQHRGSPSNDSIRVQKQLLAQYGDRMDGSIHNDGVVLLDRHHFMKQLLVSTSAAVAATSLVTGSAAEANAQGEDASAFVRRGKTFGYKFVPPPGFAEGNKPLKTHLDEVNFSKEGVRGYQYGITIDPVRLKSLSEFGTPEQVAAKIVTAEVNRDGIFVVTLYRNPVEDPITGAYEIDYISDGKRGKKHFMTRTAVQDGMLYVLTAQVKDEEFIDREDEMKSAVNTFAPGQ